MVFLDLKTESLQYFSMLFFFSSFHGVISNYTYVHVAH